MPNTPTKLQRWLDVVSFLASRRFPVPTEDLWRAVPAYARGLDGSATEKQTVRRMFERDKDELKALGIPIVTHPIHYGRDEPVGYRLAKKDFHLPYLRLLGEARPDAPSAEPGPQRVSPAPTSTFELTEAEAAAALDGLRELATIPGFPLARSARSAFRKLAFDLEPDASAEPPVLYARDPEAEATADMVRDLSGAIGRRKRVGFRYRSMTSDSEAEREAHPFGLLFQHGRWYLVGHDTARDDVRMYRVGRMSELAVNTRRPGTADYTVPDDFSLDAYAGREAWELGAGDHEPVEATVRFRFPRSLWAERNGHGTLIEEEGDDGSQRRSFVVHRPGPFVRWVLSLAGDARIEAPAELRDAFLAMAAHAATLHGERRAHG